MAKGWICDRTGELCTDKPLVIRNVQCACGVSFATDESGREACDKCADELRAIVRKRNSKGEKR